jgi:hypothetical protein
VVRATHFSFFRVGSVLEMLEVDDRVGIMLPRLRDADHSERPRRSEIIFAWQFFFRSLFDQAAPPRQSQPCARSLEAEVLSPLTRNETEEGVKQPHDGEIRLSLLL